MTRSILGLLITSGTLSIGSIVVCGCSATAGGADPSAAASTGGASSGSGGSASGSGGGPAGGNGGGFALGGSGGSGGTPVAYCDKPGPDADGDGFGVAEGDCNDCDPNANPGALDVAANQIDEDCNGKADDTVTECDASLGDLAGDDPLDAARALGLCHFTDAKGAAWGVISAKYVQADGSSAPDSVQHGLLADFGSLVVPQQGKRLLALSSGSARRPGDSGYEDPSGFDTGTTGTAPPGFPKDSPSCNGVQTAGDITTYNPAALELEIRVPTNAKSSSFKFDFYTYEFPIFVCTEFNDFFVALQSPAPPNAQSGNISFDSQGNPVSVNNGFLEVCAPQEAGGKTFTCPQGAGALGGTGFPEGAATGWLETQSPVEPGSVMKLRFAIWDMGDGILDSTVLLDDFRFSAVPAKAAETKPVPVPK